MSEKREKRIKAIAEEYVNSRNLPRDERESELEFAVKVMSHEAYENPDYQWLLEDFELGKRLGRGKFGRVFLAKEKKSDFVVAIKTLLKKELYEANCQLQLMREIEIQSHLKHPNILQLLCWFHDDHRVYLVLDFALRGEMYNILKKSPGGVFDAHHTAKYIYQVSDAIDYCHQNNVIHRDIKPENLLLTGDGNVKVADFGWSVHAPSSKRRTMCGTLDYLPPEMVNNTAHGIYVDHWCIGVLCYEFLVGSPPFESKTSEETYEKIKKLKFTFPTCVPSGAIDLILKLLTLDPERRISLKEVMKHFWILANK